MTEKRVRLLDGREVSNLSEDWRHECEARAVARMPTKEARHGHLAAVERHRGKEARQALQALAEKIFYAEHSASKRSNDEE